MRANSPSSFVASLSVHAGVVAMVFVAALYFSQQDKEKPVIFELVAGPPTAPDELKAAALGNSLKPVKLDVPKVEIPPTPEPPTPEPPAAVAPKPETTPVPAPKLVPTKTKTDNTLAKALRKSETTSYRDYLRKHPTPKPAPPVEARPAANVPRIDAQGIASGVRGGSTANTRGGGGGKAMTREEHDELDTYISVLRQRLKDAYGSPPGISDLLEAKVTFDITASGVILNPRISKSSGDKDFDESVLEAFRKLPALGPAPGGKSDTWTVAFRMHDQN